MVTAAMKLKDVYSLEKNDQHGQHIKKQSHYFANKGLSSQSCGFSSSHAWMWMFDQRKLNAKELMILNYGAREDSLESPLNCNIKPVNPKGNQSWIFIGRTDAELENFNTLATQCEELTHYKRTDAGKDWRQEEKGMTEGKMVGWHHQLNGHEFEQALELVMDREAWRV